MNIVAPLTFEEVVDEIVQLNWPALSSEELQSAAWAYYFFSIQFRESLEAALSLFPDDANLQHLAREECNTSNLSPWPGVAEPGQKMNHDEFMRRSLELAGIDSAERAHLDALGQRYLDATRRMEPMARAMAITSYEDGGLEKVFRAILTAPSWDTEALRAFRHFLVEHIRFDSDPDQGHGALSRHLRPDDRVAPLWLRFKDLFVGAVPRLAT